VIVYSQKRILDNKEVLVTSDRGRLARQVGVIRRSRRRCSATVGSGALATFVPQADGYAPARERARLAQRIAEAVVSVRQKRGEDSAHCIAPE